MSIFFVALTPGLFSHQTAQILSLDLWLAFSPAVTRTSQSFNCWNCELCKNVQKSIDSCMEISVLFPPLKIAILQWTVQSSSTIIHYSDASTATASATALAGQRRHHSPGGRGTSSLHVGFFSVLIPNTLLLFFCARRPLHRGGQPRRDRFGSFAGRRPAGSQPGGTRYVVPSCWFLFCFNS